MFRYPLTLILAAGLAACASSATPAQAPAAAGPAGAAPAQAPAANENRFYSPVAGV